MTTKKIGDGFVAVLVLFFIVSLFSYLFFHLDSSSGIDSGKVNAALSGFENNLTDIKAAQTSLIEKTDATSDFSIEDTDQEIETRGSDSGGFINIISKNILSKFFISLTNEIPGSGIIIGFLMSVVALIFSILFLRFFWGDSKI